MTQQLRWLSTAFYCYLSMAVALMMVGLLDGDWLLWMYSGAWAPIVGWSDSLGTSTQMWVSLLILIVTLIAAFTPMVCVMGCIVWSTRQYCRDERGYVQQRMNDLKAGVCLRELSQDYRHLVAIQRIGTVIFIMIPVSFVAYSAFNPHTPVRSPHVFRWSTL